MDWLPKVFIKINFLGHLLVSLNPDILAETRNLHFFKLHGDTHGQPNIRNISLMESHKYKNKGAQIYQNSNYACFMLEL